jgi:hypothetical protein
MAHYLTIPEVTEAEELVSFSTGANDHSFTVTINAGTTATWLFQAAANGTLIPLVVIVADGATIALDDVYVSGAIAGGSPDTLMTFTLDARAVRFV